MRWGKGTCGEPLAQTDPYVASEIIGEEMEVVFQIFIAEDTMEANIDISSSEQHLSFQAIRES